MTFSYVMRGIAQLAALRRHKTPPPMPAGLVTAPSVLSVPASLVWLYRRRRQKRLEQ